MKKGFIGRFLSVWTRIPPTNVEIKSITQAFCHNGVQNSPFAKEEVLVSIMIVIIP